VCIGCGFEFTPPEIKLAAEASTAAVQSIQRQPEWVGVDYVAYARHEKPGKPASMRVIYECGFVRHSEWVCFEHTGFPRQKAESWWKKRSKDPIPATVDEALAARDSLRQPSAIQVKPVGQYTEITAARFETCL
jgi:DNA repair protein RadD